MSSILRRRHSSLFQRLRKRLYRILPQLGHAGARGCDRLLLGALPDERHAVLLRPARLLLRHLWCDPGVLRPAAAGLHAVAGQPTGMSDDHRRRGPGCPATGLRPLCRGAGGVRGPAVPQHGCKPRLCRLLHGRGHLLGNRRAGVRHCGCHRRCHHCQPCWERRVHWNRHCW